ncbi:MULTISPECIES: endonuclease/exonuclease/phosphatase family protein [Tenacibaculum]|uniref:endonuclease/exonuclease/phosphatase family protein n=1 Tax=Tenacibaculum TaxID=104267 RepID=UPI001F0AA9A6|nr:MULTISPECIES: endonuclease/exonuclease/phosphatase family protein [Tenacibaculum]MCH3883198.1 endonuclease/exonuclease/phosphatase family protein [Tenacibaculum aquimarinum]MDO6600957.1 endonuclease/exonuclease/phosphatase family protein [Tenacibaculum sp. 1_MG-2023]
MKKSPIFSKLLYFINAVFATVLLLSYLLPYISPKSIATFAILSLGVPFLIVINVIFFVYWLIKLKKHFILSGLILAIGWLFASPFYKFSERKVLLNDDVKVMSYNVHLFNYYKWNKDEQTSQKIVDFITEKSPDILAIQEFYKQTDLSLSYPYKYIKLKSKRNKFGSAIFSKYPIINSGSLNFEKSANNAIFVDVLRDKDTLRIYNVHLQSLKINPNKENFGEENSEKLLLRLKNTFREQAKQTEQFLTHEQQWKGKKIICGDFNNTAYSWVYNQIVKDKKDAFVEAGSGFGKTYNYPFPARIDFILTDKSTQINQSKTFAVKYSDHFPILARVNWEK